jgi:hypothetical protein
MMQTAQHCCAPQQSRQRARVSNTYRGQQHCPSLLLRPKRSPGLQCRAQKSVSPFQSSSSSSNKPVPAQSQAVQQPQQAQDLQPISNSWQQGMATHKWQWRDSSINYVVGLDFKLAGNHLDTAMSCCLDWLNLEQLCTSTEDITRHAPHTLAG